MAAPLKIRAASTLGLPFLLAILASTFVLDVQAADVNFSINASQNVHAISPYIYGTNQFNGATAPVNLGLERLGGNRWTGYNWETNYSNAGTDYLNNSDLYLTGGQVRPAGWRDHAFPSSRRRAR